MNIDPKPARAIFIAAVRLESGERSAYLDQACEGDAELRSRVDALLQAHQESRQLCGICRPRLAGDHRSAAVGERPGTVIGPYKLLQQIGEGGMGTVYMAEQSHPVQRKVALKVIKAGMDSGQVIARFEAERQALAMMDHVEHRPRARRRRPTRQSGPAVLRHGAGPRRARSPSTATTTT